MPVILTRGLGGGGGGFPWKSYLTDSHVQAWWKFDEMVNGAILEDSSPNGYDLTNGGVQERHRNTVFGYGVRYDGTLDQSKLSMAACPNLQITQNLTVEGFVTPENVSKAGGQCYVGCMNGPKTVGWELESWGGIMRWKIRTTDGLFQCTFVQADKAFVNGKRYFIRCVYDYVKGEIVIYLQNLSDDETTITEVASTTGVTGTIHYNTALYDDFAFGGNNFDFWAGGQNHYRGVVDQWAISDVVRGQKYYSVQNILPQETDTVNIGSRLKRFDNIHVSRVYADLFIGALEPPQNVCFVSPSYTDNTESCQFSTVKAAIAHAESQSPSAASPWLIYIYPGVYAEERGTWVNNVNEASIIIPDYVYLWGASRDTVIIKPDSNVVGEPMALFAAVEEGDAVASKTSHIGLGNLTLKDCLYGDAIQLDSFIKKPDYPEFRCEVFDVKIINCNTGIKCEERNSWMHISGIYLEDCDTGIRCDDAKIFGDNVIIRQKSSGSTLSYGIYCEDKKGKIQIIGLDISPDFGGLSTAFDVGIYVEDKAEAHLYEVRVDNANVAIRTFDEGEVKVWDVKLHDSVTYDIQALGNDNIRAFAGEFSSPLSLGSGSDLSLRGVRINTKDFNAHSIQWNSTGKLRLYNCSLTSKGEVLGTDYYDINFQGVPSSCLLIGNSFRYDAGSPNYLLYANAPINATVAGNQMDKGMNGNIVVSTATKLVGGNIDCYATIQDAMTSASSGDLISVAPGTYTEQVTFKAGVILQGIDQSACVLQYSDQPIQPIDVVGSITILNMTIVTTVAGNFICKFRKGSLYLRDCGVYSGTIRLIGGELTGFARIDLKDSTFITGDENVYNIEADGAAAQLVDLLIVRCSFGEPSKGIKWGFTKGFGGPRTIIVTDSNFDWGEFELSGGNCNLRVTNCSCVTEFDHWLNYSGNRHVVILNSVIAASKWALKFTTVPWSLRLNGNLFESYDYDVYSTVAISGVDVISNTMYYGMNGNIRTKSATKNVAGGIDCYKTIKDALDSVDKNNQILLLQTNQTVTSALTPPSYSILIDGNHQFSITRAAGSSIMTLGPNDNAKFINIDLIGSIDVSGNGAKLFLADHSYLKGMIDVISGDASTEIRVEQAKIVGDAIDQYCIEITDADPTVIVKQSYLKGDAGDPAVFYNAVNNNVMMAYSTIVHGNVGANSPINKGGAVGAINLASHHNGYNAAWVAGFANTIAGPNDTFDPQVDF